MFSSTFVLYLPPTLFPKGEAFLAFETYLALLASQYSCSLLIQLSRSTYRIMLLYCIYLVLETMLFDGFLDLNLYLPSMSSYFAARFDLKCYLHYLSISPYYRFQLLLFFSFFLLYLLMLLPSLVFTYYIYSVSLDVNRIYLACSSALIF